MRIFIWPCWLRTNAILYSFTCWHLPVNQSSLLSLWHLVEKCWWSCQLETISCEEGESGTLESQRNYNMSTSGENVNLKCKVMCLEVSNTTCCQSRQQAHGFKPNDWNEGESHWRLPTACNLVMLAFNIFNAKIKNRREICICKAAAYSIVLFKKSFMYTWTWREWLLWFWEEKRLDIPKRQASSECCSKILSVILLIKPEFTVVSPES